MWRKGIKRHKYYAYVFDCVRFLFAFINITIIIIILSFFCFVLFDFGLNSRHKISVTKKKRKKNIRKWTMTGWYYQIRYKTIKLYIHYYFILFEIPFKMKNKLKQEQNITIVKQITHTQNKNIHMAISYLIDLNYEFK